MYCLQYLVPVLLVPRPTYAPTALLQHAVFMWLYVVGFFMGRQPCYICSLIFAVAVALLCYTSPDTCVLWPVCRLGEDRMRCLEATGE